MLTADHLKKFHTTGRDGWSARGTSAAMLACPGDVVKKRGVRDTSHS